MKYEVCSLPAGRQVSRKLFAVHCPLYTVFCYFLLLASS
jgi:hypothetical protein